MSDSKFNEKEINKMLKNVSGGSKIDAASLKSAAQNGSLNEYIGKTLSPETQKRLKDVLSDKKALENYFRARRQRNFLKSSGRNNNGKSKRYNIKSFPV